MNPHGEESSFCYFHPKEFLVGVCALCLKERLLSLTSKQSHLQLPKNPNEVLRKLRRKPSIAITRVFAFGSFFPRLEARTQEPSEEENNEGSIASLEDFSEDRKRFIFEADGRGSWEKKSCEGQSWLPSGRGDRSKENINGRVNSVVEKAKLHSGLRWRKRFGQLVQLVRWKRSSKAGVSHAGTVRKVESVRGRKGWMRRLTRGAVSATE